MKKIVLAAAAVASLVSCSSVSSSSERLIGSPAFPPTKPDTVVILRREPKKPHVRLGHVYIEPSGTPPVEVIEKAILLLVVLNALLWAPFAVSERHFRSRSVSEYSQRGTVRSPEPPSATRPGAGCPAPSPR